MTDVPIHVFPDRGPGEWVAYADYAALLTHAEKSEAACDEWSSVSQGNYQRAKKAVAERDALQAEVDRLIDLCRVAYLEGYGHGQIDADMTTRGKTVSSIQDDAGRSWDGFSYARTLITNPTPPTP